MTLENAYLNFRPRPDQPGRFDQQTAFYESKTHGVSWLIGGNGAGTSEVACAKIAKFVYETPPPRWDTPFWVISNTYKNVMESLWKEKLYGHGHILHHTIDWPRVEWHKSTQGWPFRVPLLPHPGIPGRNWCLEFLSYEQGRQNMQARSIGGFCFSEQFPWGLLEEVLRGCREYDFPGSKFCEFTPVDPNLSVEIESLIEEDKLPPGWEVYRANTECAMEAGHVQKGWFEQFFGMIPDETRETRLTGQFATYEGAVYKGFNPLVHLVDDRVMVHPPGVLYRRGIDWGAGPENAFCALLAYRNGLGQWYVFDEYYSTDQELTTVDHLCNVQDLWPWPVNNPHYGTSWADPSSPDNIRLAQNLTKYCPRDKSGEPLYSPMAIMRGRNAVIEGIEHIQYLLKPSVPYTNESGETVLQPRLFIHKGNCPNLARQMRSYRWIKPSEQGLNPQNPRKEPLKKNDHAVDALRYILFSEATHTGNVPSSMQKQRRSKERGVILAKR